MGKKGLENKLFKGVLVTVGLQKKDSKGLWVLWESIHINSDEVAHYSNKLTSYQYVTIKVSGVLGFWG